MKLNVHIESDDPEEIHRITAALAGAESVTKTVGNLSVTTTEVKKNDLPGFTNTGSLHIEDVPPILGKVKTSNGDIVEYLSEWDSSSTYKVSDFVLFEGVAFEYREVMIAGEMQFAFVPVRRGGV